MYYYDYNFSEYVISYEDKFYIQELQTLAMNEENGSKENVCNIAINMKILLDS